MINTNNKLNFSFSSDLEEGWELITVNGDYSPVMQLLDEAYYDRLQWLFDMCNWAQVSTDWVLLDCQSIVDKVGNISNQFTAGIITRQEKNGKITACGEIISKYHNLKCEVSEALAVAIIYGIELWLVFEEEEVQILKER